MNRRQRMRSDSVIWAGMHTYFTDWQSAARSMSLSLFSLPLPAITRNSLKRSVGSAETSLKAAHKNPFLSGNSCWWQVKGEKMPHAAFFSVWYSQDRHPRLKAEEAEVEEEEVTTGTGRPHVVPCLARLRYFVRWRFKKNSAEGQVTQSASVRACGRVLACVFLVCAWIDEIRAWLGPPCCNNVHEEEEAEAKEGTGSGCSHACGLTGAHGSAELRRPLSNTLLAPVALLSLFLPLRVLIGAI